MRTPVTARRRSLALVAFAFLLSGATGLTYEVVWRRMLGLLFGESATAVTAVIAAFMAGLAIGSACIVRLARRIGDPLRIYGWLEVGVAVTAAITPWTVALVGRVSDHLHRLPLPSVVTSTVDVTLMASVLLIPTALMGATLPLIVDAVARECRSIAGPVSVLYALNTLGAVLGAAAAGYVLLPALGNRQTLGVAVIVNAAIGVFTVGYARLRAPATADPDPATRPAPRRSTAPWRPPQPVWLTLFAIAVSGAVGMVYEVAWTRALALVIGSSTYAFTAMLVAFLIGLAGGSGLYGWRLARHGASPAMFGALQAAIGLGGIVALATYEQMPVLFLSALSWSHSVPFVRVVQVAMATAALLPMTVFCGAAFPCAVALCARSSDTGGDVGRVYAANTVGTVAGVLLAGLALVPTIGVRATLCAGIVTNILLAAAIVVLMRSPAPPWRWAVAGAGAVGVVSLAALPSWNAQVLSSGPAIYAMAYRAEAAQSSFQSIVRRQDVVFYRDGPTSSVSVNRDGAHLFLRINGKTDAGTGDMATQLMLGHLPLMFQAEPRRVLVIGLGSGITAGAVAAHPVERIDVVEIEPAVVEAAAFFGHVHGDVLRDPRVRVRLADARSLVRTMTERYDVIISEPSNPWLSAVSELFTVEFFQLARDHLTPGGSMVQWIHGYNLFADDLRMVVKTFRAVFPSATLWEPVPGDFLLLGRTEPGPLDPARVRTRLAANPAVQRDVRRLGVQAWPGFFSFVALGESETARLAEPGALNTDDRLPLEFSAPRALYADTTAANERLVRSFRRAGVPPVDVADLRTPEAQYWIGMALLNRGLAAEAVVQFEQALRRDPSYQPALLALSAMQFVRSAGHPVGAIVPAP